MKTQLDVLLENVRAAASAESKKKINELAARLFEKYRETRLQRIKRLIFGFGV
jgi:hypothetical protein